ncbi:MAG: hypothetical protein AAGE89_07320 [Pseudomonadota bacterium]
MNERHAAKIHNEKTKLLSTSLNAVGIALFLSGAIFPIVRDHDTTGLLDFLTWIWILTGIALHIVARVNLNRLKDEG